MSLVLCSPLSPQGCAGLGVEGSQEGGGRVRRRGVLGGERVKGWEEVLGSSVWAAPGVGTAGSATDTDRWDEKCPLHEAFGAMVTEQPGEFLPGPVCRESREGVSLVGAKERKGL